MFQYYWPEDNMCDKCYNFSTGSMFYISTEPVYFICATCDPSAHCDAVRFSTSTANEEMINGWEWSEPDEYISSESTCLQTK